MSNISSSGGGYSFPRSEQVSSSVKRQPLLKRTIEEIEPLTKKQKISEMFLSLNQAMVDTKKIKDLPVTPENTEIYSKAHATFLKYKSDPMRLSLVSLPQEVPQKRSEIFAFYYRTFDYALKKIIANHPNAQKISLIQKMEKWHEEKLDISQMSILTQIFPESDKEYEKDKQGGRYNLLPLKYDVIEDIAKSPEQSEFLMLLIEKANPEIRQTLLSKEKFFEKDVDNDIFIKNFIEKYKDNPVVLSRILDNNRVLSSNPEESDILLHNMIDNYSDIIRQDSQNLKSENLDLLLSLAIRDASLLNKKDNFLEKLIDMGKEIDKKFKDPDLLITLGLQHEVYNRKDFLDNLINVAQRPRLSPDNTEHHNRLTALVDLAEEMDRKFQNPDLLMTLGLRHEVYERKDFLDNLIDVAQRSRLSPDDTEHHNRLTSLVDLGQKIDETFQNPDLLITLGLHDEVCYHKKFCDSLINIAQRPRLSSDNTEHNDRLAVLVDLAKEMDETFHNPDLLITLGLRYEVYEHENFLDNLINIAQRPRLSSDDTEHRNRLTSLVDLGQRIDETFGNPDLLITLGLHDEVCYHEKFRNILMNIAQRSPLSLDNTEHYSRLKKLINLGRKIFNKNYNADLIFNITGYHDVSSILGN